MTEVMMFCMRVVLGVGIWCAVATGLGGCGSEEEPAAPDIRPVRYMRIYTAGGDRLRTFSGVTRAGIETNLSFKVPGTIQSVDVEVGYPVKPGDLIASLNAEDYQLQVQEAEAALDRYQAESRNASANYERVSSLYESRNASLNDLDAARAANESSKAAVRAAQKQLEMVNLQMGYTRLTAPVAGAIAKVDVEVNENVKAGNTVATLSAGTQPEVEISVPEVFITKLRRGDNVKVTLDALPGREFDATVTEVGVSSTGLSTTFPVTVRLHSENADIRPGMAAEVALRLNLGQQRERIVVPPLAVHEDRQGRFVFVVEPSGDQLGLAHRRTVQVGELTDEGLEITDGLLDGELLITAGVSRIHDGMTVKILDEFEDHS